MTPTTHRHLSLPRPHRTCRAAAAALALGAAPTVHAALEDASGKEIFAAVCAACHGAELGGGQAQSLVDAVWQFGGKRSAIFRNVKYGVPDFAMPGFEAALTDGQINRVIDFVLAEEKASGATRPPPPERLTTLDYEVKVEPWVTGLDLPWGIAFTGAGGRDALVTERGGALRTVAGGKLDPAPITGTPQVLAEGQGGLLDVAVDPDYADNGWVYLAYSHAREGGGRRPPAMTRIVRGRVKDGAWTDEEVVFEARPEHYSGTRHHYGCRVVFGAGEDLFFSVGDRGAQDQAQDLSRPNGKVHRVKRDGTVPPDNVLSRIDNALPSVFTYGNRNPQGLAIHPETGKLWGTEHGPFGGDELNLLRPGKNYGWPRATYGRNYDGRPVSPHREVAGTESPALYWSPSIAVCGAAFVTGDRFPRWRHRLLVAALKYEEVRLLNIREGRVLHQEVILKNAGRVRDVECGPDGAVYVVLNGPGTILRLTPERDMVAGK